jgi:hypothetical protein
VLGKDYPPPLYKAATSRREGNFLFCLLVVQFGCLG